MTETAEIMNPFDKDVLSDSHPLPLYMQLSRHIRTLILTGRLGHQDALPGERDLAERFSVSRVTVRKALRELTAEGLLRQRQGAGTFVNHIPHVEQRLPVLTSFSEDMQRRGLVGTSIWLQRRVGIATPEETRLLALADGDGVARFHRLRLANDTPVAIELTVVPSRFMPAPASVDVSLYAALRRSGYVPYRATQKITAVELSPVQANLLRMPPKSPALHMERRTLLQDGRPLELSRSHYRGDIYDFIVELNLSSHNPPLKEGA